MREDTKIEVNVQIDVPKIEVNILAELPTLKQLLEDRRFWHVIVNYTVFEMLAKSLIKEYFKGKGIVGMDDWIEKLSCMRLTNRLHKLKLVDYNTFKKLKRFVEIRNKLVHDFRETMIIKMLDEKEIENIIHSSNEILSQLVQSLSSTSNSKCKS